MRQLVFEIEQLDLLVATYDAFLDRLEQQAPDLVELTAAAAVIHAFYTGIERAFLIIARRIDRVIPGGAQHHRDLLDQMTRSLPSRGAVIDGPLAALLGDFLGFRHFYRHSYTFSLDWDKLAPLVAQLRPTWQEARRQLLRFAEVIMPKDGNA